MLFLTEIDSRAQVKGSRDPLGFVPVWSRFGRRVVGNLTTVSNSVRGFTTLLLGYYFAEQAQERFGKDVGSTLDLFLKFEQLAAYCRYHASSHQDGDFRGVERVGRTLEQGTSVEIGAEQDTQILSNQKVYGLWGLFSVPARNSGLLKQEELTLEDAAREHVEAVLLPALKKRGLKDPGVILDLLKRERVTVYLDGRHAQLASALARTLGPKLGSEERRFYEQHLLLGGDDDATQGCQPHLAELLKGLPGDMGFGMGELLHVVNAAGKRGWDDLHSRLDAIHALEPLLVAATESFALLCSRDGEPFAEVAGELAEHWKGALRFLRVDKLESELSLIQDGYADEALARRLLEAARAFSGGDVPQALRLLIQQNADIMKSRHAAEPWVRIERSRLKVHFADEVGALPKKSELPHIWKNTYFINSLQNVARTLGDA
ncbi:hypothetical protein ACLESD_01020 [Pyxidicoccus sp. 3LFB2]